MEPMTQEKPIIMAPITRLAPIKKPKNPVLNIMLAPEEGCKWQQAKRA
jgi:hypothetical protein